MPWTPAAVRGQSGVVATEDSVRQQCLALPGVVERTSWGRPAWFARTLMARIWEDGVVTVKTQEREALAATDPDTFFWTPHHERSPSLVLVRLDRVSEDELGELLAESYRIAGSR
jgi:hypothetical protein